MAEYLKDALEGLRTYAARSDGGVPPELLDIQARRVAAIVERIEPGRALVLPDPVGTGKTAVSVAAASMLLDAGTVSTAVVVAPSQTVREIWKSRAQRWLGARIARRIDVVTRAGLPDRPPRHPGTTLVVVDEAHRGLQSDGAFRSRLAPGFHRSASRLVRENGL